MANIGPVVEFVNRVWDYISKRPKKKLENERRELEVLSRRAQLNGDLDELRRTRAEITEIDRRLSIGDY